MPANTEMGKLHLERGHTSLAMDVFTERLNECPDDAEAIFHLGSCFLQMGKYGTAITLLAKAAELMSTNHNPLVNLASCYRYLNKTEIAESLFRMAMERAPNDRVRGAIMANIGGCYVNNGTPDKAVAIYKEAERLAPQETGILYNRGLVELERGNWLEGFALYEMGLLTGNRTNRSYPGIKQFRTTGSLAQDLTQIKDKTVIVWGDQGIGDEIMFASCIPDLMRDAKRVIFDCHPRMVRLFEQSFGIECHGTRKTGMGEWHFESGADISVCISTLAMLYRYDGDFPGKQYLQGLPQSKRGGLNIGISWQGGVPQNRSDLRSVDLETLRPVLESVDANFYSLQYTSKSDKDSNPARDCGEFEEATGIHIHHWPSKVECEDYATTAEFVSTMDLVITVCTSIAHVSGALGVPTWVLTPAQPAWRYGVSGPMPWYKSVTLYRQETPGDWGPVIKRMSDDLRARYVLQAAE